MSYECKVKKGHVVYSPKGEETRLVDEIYLPFVVVSNFLVLLFALLIPIPFSLPVGILLVVWLHGVMPVIFLGGILYFYTTFPAEFSQVLSVITGV